MREVGTDIGHRRSARYHMAIGARATSEKLRAQGRFTRREGLRRCPLSLQPFPELRLRLGDHSDTHPCVLRTAKFRTRSQVNSRMVRLEPDRVAVPGNDVDLAG